MVARYGRAPKGERARGKAPRNWGKNVTLISSITLEGMGPSMSIQGSSDTEAFSLYMREVLAPCLKSGQIILMDNLSVHRSLGEGSHRREGMPAVAPAQLFAGDEPHRGGFLQGEEPHIRKAKARTLQVLFAATSEALGEVSEEDARAFFEDSGYEALRGHPL